MLSTYDFSGTYGTAPSLFQQPLLYGYTYDPLNRLVLADGTVGDFVAGASNEQLNDSYLIGDEDYTYDKIGNITRLQRKLRSPEPLEMVKNEGWYYNYALGNNRLMSVSGMPGSVTRGYSYDPNGNLLTDTHRGIIGTEYGRAAYAYEIKDGTNKFLYLYSTDDQRMYKKVETPTGTTTEFYLQDAGGKTVAVRRKVDAAPAEWEYYVNGTEREARLKGLNHTGGIEPKEIEFYLYDHLGNTRVVYQPKVAGANLELVINYVADYFPYGKILKEYVNTGSGDPEKFLTTQHERDKETGLDYRGARYYDSDIARFLSVDPWATKYPAWSTYNYVMGNPIGLIDPTGKGPEDWVKNMETGEYVWDQSVTGSDNTPEGFKYIGSENDDIVRDLFGKTTFQDKTENNVTYGADSGPGYVSTKHAKIFTTLNVHIDPIIEYGSNDSRTFKGIEFLASSSGKTFAPLLFNEPLTFQETNVNMNGVNMNKVIFPENTPILSSGSRHQTGSGLYKYSWSENRVYSDYGKSYSRTISMEGIYSIGGTPVSGTTIVGKFKPKSTNISLTIPYNNK